VYDPAAAEVEAPLTATRLPVVAPIVFRTVRLFGPSAEADAVSLDVIWYYPARQT
jgi:hypothetical protein